MALSKTHLNSLGNLLNKYSKDDIVAAMDKMLFAKADYVAKQKVFATDESAVEWFTNFCSQYNLTVRRVMHKDRDGNEVPYGRYVVEEMDDTYKPYFTLWINDGHQNAHQTPHVELGSSYEDLWWASSLQELENKMHKICYMRGFKKAA